MTICNTKSATLPRCKRRSVQLNFDGGNVSSDGGAVLLREADRKLGLTQSIARLFDDPRRKSSCEHSFLSMLRQRVYAIAMGYEDVNDHLHLRNDILLQTLVGQDESLASCPTLSRFENSVDQSCILKFNQCFVESFLNAYPKAPTEIVLDFDATDDPVHGNQAGGHYRRYYKNVCFLPLYVYCGEHLLFSYLRPGNVMGFHNVRPTLKFLVGKIRERWPNVKIIFRADGEFCDGKILHWCDKNRVSYITGMRGYANIKRRAAFIVEKSQLRFLKTNKSSVHYSSFKFRTNSVKSRKYWPRARRIIARSRMDQDGGLLRFLVTDLKGSSKHLYEKIYSARGDMENRLKEQKRTLFSDRTSCSKWDSNQFRVMMTSAAYVLMHAIRRIALAGTYNQKAQCQTIRLKFFKIGAVITKNTRRIRFQLASHYPYQQEFFAALARLTPT